MTALDELTAIALIGTDRRPASAPTSAGPLGEAIARQPWDRDPAAAVLTSAAFVAVTDRAGVTARQLDSASLPVPAPPERTASCSPGAVMLLRRLIADPDGRAALPDALRRLASRQEHAPPLLVPALMDLGNEARALRPLLWAAMGNRGVWLAAQHPERWTWAVRPTESDGADADRSPGLVTDGDRSDPAAAEAAGIWAFGTVDRRLALLVHRRAEAPDRARELVESTWDQDPPADRARFVHALRDGLGPADEPLLERARSDRRKDVREAGIALLSALPESAFRERMTARLRPLVSSKGSLLGRRLRIELPPESLDAEATRDGLKAKARGDLGARSAMLADLVAGAGLALWTDATAGAATPDDALKMLRGDPHEQAVRAGWRIAAARECDPAWCTALAVDEFAPGLLVGLRPAEAEPAALSLLDRTRKHTGDVARILSSVPGPWSRAVSDAAVDAIVRTGGVNLDRPTQRDIAAHLHPTAIPRAAARLARGVDDAPHLDALLHVLDLRQTLIRELPTA